MGINTNRYGKKSDKETQSPLLTIFKEIMMKEKNDPEKQNLLDQKDYKRPRQYSTARLKQECECDNITSRNRSARNALDEATTVLPSSYSRTEAEEDDICACMSCALKRLIGSEFTCIVFLILIFLISISAACIIVFKTLPAAASQAIMDTDYTTKSVPNPDACSMDSERLKRKIEMIGENIKKELNEDGVFGQVPYDKMEANMMDGYESPLLDLGPRLRDLSDFGDAYHGDRIGRTSMEDKNTDKLINFYDKLLETDAKIKNLKRMLTVEDNLYHNIDDDKTPDRTKRSLKLYNYPKRYKIMRRKQGIYDLRKKLKPAKAKNKTRVKRSFNETRKPAGFVIEKKKIIVEYDPGDGKKLVPKCSHAPIDAHARTHEHQRKHPFYQNTQRLDELLDRFLNKNLPEILDDPFDLDFLFKHTKNKCKHPSTVTTTSSATPTQRLEYEKKKEYVKSTTKRDKSQKVTDSTYNVNKYFESPLNQIPKPKANNKYNKYIHETTARDVESLANSKIRKFTESSTSNSGMLLSVSTVMSPNLYPRNAEAKRNVTNMRHLLQMEGEEEENLGYEDFKEVLTDDLENQDDFDRRGERKKRGPEFDNITTEPKINKSQRISMKYGVPVMLNPNWKGPMPLYPDELSTMIKQQSPLGEQNHKSPEIQVDSRDIKRSLSDVEYVEDYLSSKYNQLVEMAQAYSDYGVLEGKKDGVTMEKKQVTENIVPSSSRVQLSADWHLLPRGLLTMKNKDKEQYGTTKGINNISSFTNNIVDIKIQPTTEDRDDIELTNLINNHIKLDTTTTPKKTSTTNQINIFNEARIKKHSNRRINYGFLNNLTFSVNKRRNLLSTLFNNVEYDNDGADVDYDSFDKSEEKDKDSKNKREIYPSILKRAFGFDKMKDTKPNDNHKLQMSDPMRNFDDSIPKYNLMFGNSESDSKYRTHMTMHNLDVFRFPYLYETLPLSVTSSTETVQPPENLDHLPDDNSKIMSMLMYNANYSVTPTDPYINITANPDDYRSSSDFISYNSSMDFQTYTNELEKMSVTINQLHKKYTTKKYDFKQHQKDVMEANALADHLYELDLKDLKNPPVIETTTVATESVDRTVTYDLDQLAKQLQSLDHSTYPTVDVQKLRTPDLNPSTNNYTMDSINSNTGDEFGHRFPTTETTDSPHFNYNSTMSTSIKPKTNLDFYKFYTSHTRKNVFFKSRNGSKSFTAPFVVDGDARVITDNYERQIAMSREPDAGYVNIADGFNSALVADMNKYENDKELGEDKNLDDVNRANNADTTENANINNDVDYLNYENEISDKMLNVKKRSSVKNDRIRSNDDKNNKYNNTRNNNMIVDYFGMISDWFQNPQSEKKSPNKPFYRSGRKSRVLMSLKEDNATEEPISTKSLTLMTVPVERNQTAGNDPSLQANVTEQNTKDKTNNTPTTGPVSESTTSDEDQTTTDTVKTDMDIKKVKRNADESNLIFWNDIYDDEYGIYTNTADRTVRSRLYPKESDFLRRSGRWVQDKIKKFADNIRGREQELPFKKRLRRATRNFKIGEYPKFKRRFYGNLYKRSSSEDETPDTYQMSVFNSLGAKMVEVCKKAAQSVRQASSPNTGEKGEPAQASVTTTLMQQLVHLLTDLIDYQIQATTCAKLPPDLRKFLEWLVLTDNDDEMAEAVSYTSSPHSRSTLPYPEDEIVDEIVVPTKAVPDTTYFVHVMPLDMKYDTRHQYADTVRSVNELVDEYEDISDPYKYNNLQTEIPYPRKRVSYKTKLRIKQPKYRYKRKVNKFIKTFEKKHTRTTAASYYYDSVLSTDTKSKSPDKMVKLQTPSKSFKRNLKDVYFRAIAEAKKFAASGKGSNRNIISTYTTGPPTKLNNIIS